MVLRTRLLRRTVRRRVSILVFAGWCFAHHARPRGEEAHEVSIRVFAGGCFARAIVRGECRRATWFLSAYSRDGASHPIAGKWLLTRGDGGWLRIGGSVGSLEGVVGAFTDVFHLVRGPVDRGPLERRAVPPLDHSANQQSSWSRVRVWPMVIMLSSQLPHCMRA